MSENSVINESITKDLANREGQTEIAKAILNFGSLKNAIRSETAAALSERSANRSYYYSCESEIAADVATTLLNSVRNEMGRLLRVPESVGNFDPTVPIVPGKCFMVNSDGTGFIAFTPSTAEFSGSMTLNGIYWDARNRKIINALDGIDEHDVATKGQLDGKLSLSGGTMTGSIVLSSGLEIF